MDIETPAIGIDGTDYQAVIPRLEKFNVNNGKLSGYVNFLCVVILEPPVLNLCLIRKDSVTKP